MDEKEWAACSDPEKMLELLRSTGKLSQRKARLFACAAVRRVWHLLTDERSRRAVEVTEEYADGLVTEPERLLISRLAMEARSEIFTGGGGHAADMAASAVEYVAAADEDFMHSPEGDEFMAAWGAAYCAAESVASGVRGRAGLASGVPADEEVRQREYAAQAFLLRDHFGPLLFRPVTLPPSVRTWNEGLVRHLAKQAYEHRLLPSGHLDPERLGVLADALEEAGADAEIVEHLRGPGPHVRGCAVVDLLTDRE